MGLSLTEMWNTLAKERFLVLRTVFQRGLLLWHIPCSIPTSFKFFLPSLPWGQHSCWLGMEIALWHQCSWWNPSLTVEGSLHYCSGPEHQHLSLAFCSDCGLCKNLTPEHLRLILSQPETVASKGGCPVLPAGNLLLWACMFLHSSQASVSRLTPKAALNWTQTLLLHSPRSKHWEQGCKTPNFQPDRIRFMESGLWKH